MTSALLKQRRKSLSSLSSPPPIEVPDPLGSQSKRASYLLPDYFNAERPESIEEEQQSRIQLLQRMILSWQNRWKQENEDKMKLVRKMEQQRLAQKLQIQRYAHARDQMFNEKHSLERCFRKSVQQNTLEKMELKKSLISMAEETDSMKKQINEQNVVIDELKAKLEEYTDANNNQSISSENQILSEQNDKLVKQLKHAQMQLKQSELRDENYNVLLQTSLDRLRILEACLHKPKRGCSGGRYVMHVDEMQPSNMYLHDHLRTVITGYETQSLGSLDSLDSILEDSPVKANGVSVSAQTSPIRHQPLQMTRSADLLPPIVLSSPDLTHSPENRTLQRKGSLDFDRIPPQRRKRSSGFDFLRIKHSSPHAPSDGKRKRRTAEFADLLRKITNGVTSTSDSDKRHSLGSHKNSKRKSGSLKR